MRFLGHFLCFPHNALMFHSFSVKSTFQNQLLARNVSVTATALFDLSFPASTIASIFTALERSASRVAVVLGTVAEFQVFMSSVREIPFEVVWLDPQCVLAAHERFNSSFFNSASVLVGVPHGFMAIEASPKSPSSALMSRFYSNYTVGAVYIDRGYLSLLYDSVMLWSNALSSINAAFGNISDGALVGQTLRNSTGFIPGAITGTFSFDAATGFRSGDLEFLNFYWNGTGSAYSGNWSSVGMYSSETSSRSALLSLNSTALRFHSGTNNVPGSSRRPFITVGLVWATLRPIHSAWRRIVDMAMEDINANTSVVPGYILRTVFVDNSDSGASTINAAGDLINRGVVGILGPSRSTQSIALQYYIGGLRVPNIGHSSTADVLSEKLNFPTFFRTVIRDSFQARAMISFMKQNSWANFCVINFSDDYGTGVTQTLINLAANQGMNVMERTSFTTTNINVTATLEPTVRAGCRIIVFVPEASTFGRIMQGAKAAGIFARPEYVWIFSESIAGDLTASGIAAKNLTSRDFQGSFITRPLDGPPASALYQNYSTRVRQRTADLGFATDVPLFGGQLYDAVWTLALAAGRMFTAGSDPRTQRADYLSFLRNTSFYGVSGPVSFDANQDRAGASYGVYNFISGLGSVLLIGIFRDGIGLSLSAEPVFYDNTTVVPVDLVPLPLLAIEFRNAGAGIILALTVLVLAASTVSGVVVTVLRTSKLIYRSSPTFLAVFLFGIICSAVSIFFWFGRPTDALCHLRVWLGFLGAAIAYGALLAKNWRLYYLFNEPSLRVIAIRNSHLFVALSVIVAPMLIVLVLWSSLAPFRIHDQVSSGRSGRYETCVSPNDRIFAPIAFCYMFVAMGIGAFLSFKTRTLPDTFNESRYIALSTYNLLFVSAVGILISYILAFEPSAFTYIIAVCLLFGCCTTFGLIMIPKLWLLFFRRSLVDKSDPTHFTRGTRASSSRKTGTTARGQSVEANPARSAASYKTELMISAPESMVSTAAVRGSTISPMKGGDYDVDISDSVPDNSASLSAAAEESPTEWNKSSVRKKPSRKANLDNSSNDDEETRPSSTRAERARPKKISTVSRRRRKVAPPPSSSSSASTSPCDDSSTTTESSSVSSSDDGSESSSRSS